MRARPGLARAPKCKPFETSARFVQSGILGRRADLPAQQHGRNRSQGIRLRLRLHLSEVPELLNLPWEYLYDPSANNFLALSVDTPLVRYLDLPERIQPG